MFYLFIFPVILLNSPISFKGLLSLLLAFLFCVFRFLGMVYVDHQFSSVQFNCSVMSDSLRLHEPQHARPPCPSPTPGVHPNLCPLSWWCPQPSHPLLSPSPPALNLSQHQGLFQWVNSLHEVAKVLEFQLQHQSFQWVPRTDLLQDGLVGSPCSPRDSQESSPTPQFKSINFLVLSFLLSPTLTSIHDYSLPNESIISSANRDNSVSSF